MCLIAIQLNQHPTYKLIFAANRDEEYQRPTLPAHFWPDYPDLLAGQDLTAHGTWLGITKLGRIAAVTNSQLIATSQDATDKLSRGNLVVEYLTGQMTPSYYLEQVSQRRLAYNGFNLIVGSSEELCHYNNVLNQTTTVHTGNHALSNATLNTPWPKVNHTKAAMAALTDQSTFDEEDLFAIMADGTLPATIDLPDLPLPLPFKQAAATNFIKTDHYGTRSTTLILIDHFNQVTFVERSYLPLGATDVRFSFTIA